MANLKYFLWLTTRKGFQSGDANQIIAHFGTPEGAYFADETEYALMGLPEAKRKVLLDKNLSEAEKILADCDREDIHIMTIQDADYPERLSQIYDPPAVLYWKGKALSVDDRLTVALVGTRKCSPYGEEVAGRLGLELARNGVTLVSGMAEGIDAAGLRGALQGGGSVISVLGGGLDVIYPYKNRWLYQDVMTTGTLISEYPPGTEHAGFHFPIRNRILTGLSMGVAVVEAPMQSGALISARHALEQNREVFAVPGPIGSAASLGCNRLIQRGEAKLILSAADILEELRGMTSWSAEVLPPMEEAEAAQRLETAPVSAPLPREREEEKEVDKAPRRRYISLSDDPEAFTEDERDILLAIRDREHTADEISEKAQIPARRVLSALTMLQLRGLVEERAGKRFYASIILTK